MKIGLIVYTTDSETAWNAFRLGVFALKQGESRIIFAAVKRHLKTVR